MTTCTKTILDIESWQAYADVLSFLANEFLTPMNRSHDTRGLDPKFWADMPEPENELGKNAQADLIAFARSVQDFNDSKNPNVPSLTQVSVQYTHLFIGPPRPTAGPWETVNTTEDECHIGFGKSTVLMKRLLNEEGLELSSANRQFEDHIGIELLYLSVLCNKAALALEQNDDSEACDIAEKTLWFTSRHPAKWIVSLKSKVEGETPNGYYAYLLSYTQGVLEDLVSHLSII